MHRVALNGRFSGTPQPTGTQTASFQLFDAIVRERRHIDLIVFADSRFNGVAAWKDVPNVTFVETPFQDMSRGRAHYWEQIQFPLAAHKLGAQLLHHPMTTSSWWQNGMKSVVTLHDLNFYLHPEWYSRSFRLVYKLFAVPGFHKAERVITISRYVQDQVRRIIGVREDRLGMIYNGVKAMTASAAPPSEKPYLLCVGSLQPHKNLARTIQAFLKVRADFPDLELRIVGRPQARFAKDEESARLLTADGVKLLGYLSEADLAAAYAGAAAFCYPSLEEGFGLPILEAMTLGTLVLTSNVSCLPEVAGPATQCDPLSVDAIAAGINELLTLSPDDRAQRVVAGYAWAGKFTWQAAAKNYLALYRELLG